MTAAAKTGPRWIVFCAWCYSDQPSYDGRHCKWCHKGVRKGSGYVCPPLCGCHNADPRPVQEDA